ncbi:hypothetical protein, partial [Sinorhizobium meliloti]|uniref:hypothetical protein n=1 Tax=Rhizobium meliloti TaxID=382 RepID=UPI001AECE729
HGAARSLTAAQGALSILRWRDCTSAASFRQTFFETIAERATPTALPLRLPDIDQGSMDFRAQPKSRRTQPGRIFLAKGICIGRSFVYKPATPTRRYTACGPWGIG